MTDEAQPPAQERPSSAGRAPRCRPPCGYAEWRTRGPWRARPSRSAAGIVLAIITVLAGCTTAGRGAAGVGLRLSVANAGQSTITQVDLGSGSTAVVPLPAGSAPE